MAGAVLLKPGGAAQALLVLAKRLSIYMADVLEPASTYL